MNEQKKNINWINILKAFCIIDIYFVHCQNHCGYSVDTINLFTKAFYVNAFFFVSGYLLFWKQLSSPIIDEEKSMYFSLFFLGGKKLLYNVVFRIIIPSIIFSAIEFLPSCIIQSKGIDLDYALYKTIGGGTYWFTSALVVAELVLLILFCTRKNNIWFYQSICFLLGVVGLLIIRLEIIESDIWAWKQGMIALLFLAMGGIYWKYEKWIDKVMMHWWVTMPLLLVYVSLVVFAKDYTDPLISTLTIQPLGFITSAIVCVLLVWFCKRLPEVRFLTFIGQNSLGFYFMSGALPITFSMIVSKYFSCSAWLLIIVWFLCLGIAYIGVTFINSWMPWLWDLRNIQLKKC